MLDPKDLQAIAELIDARALKTEDKIEELSGRIGVLEETTGELSGKIISLKDKITRVEIMFSNQLVRTEDIFKHKLEKVEMELREIKEYYRVNRIENGNVDLTLQILEEFQKRLEILEKKFA